MRIETESQKQVDITGESTVDSTTDDLVKEKSINDSTLTRTA